MVQAQSLEGITATRRQDAARLAIAKAEAMLQEREESYDAHACFAEKAAPDLEQSRAYMETVMAKRANVGSGVRKFFRRSISLCRPKDSNSGRQPAHPEQPPAGDNPSL